MKPGSRILLILFLLSLFNSLNAEQKIITTPLINIENVEPSFENSDEKNAVETLKKPKARSRATGGSLSAAPLTRGVGSKTGNMPTHVSTHLAPSPSRRGVVVDAVRVERVSP